MEVLKGLAVDFAGEGDSTVMVVDGFGEWWFVDEGGGSWR